MFKMATCALYVRDRNSHEVRVNNTLEEHMLIEIQRQIVWLLVKF